MAADRKHALQEAMWAATRAIELDSADAHGYALRANAAATYTSPSRRRFRRRFSFGFQRTAKDQLQTRSAAVAKKAVKTMG
jgi:hypothetical protein